MGRAGRRLNAEHDAEVAQMEGDAATTQLLLDLRAFARMPRRVHGGDPEKAAERSFAQRFFNARRRGRFTAEHESQLIGMSVEEVQYEDQLMEDLLAFGRGLKERKGTDPGSVAETRLACRRRRARASGRSPCATAPSRWCAA